MVLSIFAVLPMLGRRPLVGARAYFLQIYDLISDFLFFAREKCTYDS